MIKLAPLALSLTACAATVPCACAPAEAPPAMTVLWSDGDSGRYYQDGAEIPFRIHGMDTPEAGRSKRRYIPGNPNGPQCPAEWEKAIAAYDAARTIIDGAALQVTQNHGLDRFNRQVIDLSVNGQDYAATMQATGHGKPWNYDGGEPKPDWCAQ